MDSITGPGSLQPPAARMARAAVPGDMNMQDFRARLESVMSLLRHRWRTTVALLTTLLAACVADSGQHDPRPSPSTPPLLVLLSLDGFHPDYLERGLTPTLDRLADEGVRAQWLIPSFPSKTFPNHYTIVTGLVPDHHGIVDNVMRDPELGRFTLSDRDAVGDGRWWQGEPLWITAHRHGLRSGIKFWPGSEAAIGGIRPDFWYPFDAGVPLSDRVGRVLGWLDLAGRDRIDFIGLYFEQVDTAGHHHGPDSPEVDAALAQVDAAVAQLLAGLRGHRRQRPFNLVIVSDHGMASVQADRELVLEDVVDPALIEIVTLAEISGFHPRPGHEAAVERALLRRHEGMTCHRRTGLPAHWRYGRHPRVPDIVCLLHDGWRITRREAFNPWRQVAMNRGAHGYDPGSPAMRGIFIATGVSLRQQLRVPAFGNEHVYALLCRLLGIEPADNDGDPAVTKVMLKGPTDR